MTELPLSFGDILVGVIECKTANHEKHLETKDSSVPTEGWVGDGQVAWGLLNDTCPTGSDQSAYFFHLHATLASM